MYNNAKVINKMGEPNLSLLLDKLVYRNVPEQLYIVHLISPNRKLIAQKFCEVKMSKFTTNLIYFLTVLVISQTSFSENHHGQYEHPVFKQIDNVKNFMRQKMLCGSFFQKDELHKHFQECIGELTIKGEPSSSAESIEVAGQDDILKKVITSITNHTSLLFQTGKLGNGSFRTRREAITGNLMNQQGGNYWKLFENPHVFKNPCLISCVLEKFEMINSTGHSQIEKIQARAEEILSSANKTNFSSVASNITNTCVRERDAQEHSLGSTVTESASENHDVNSGGMAKAKCRFVIQFGKCLALHIFQACDEGAKFNLTSSANKNAKEETYL